MKKIIIIILLVFTVTGIMGFALTKHGSNNLISKSSEKINPLPASDKMQAVNLSNDDQWN